MVAQIPSHALELAGDLPLFFVGGLPGEGGISARFEIEFPQPHLFQEIDRRRTGITRRGVRGQGKRKQDGKEFHCRNP